MRKKIKKCLKRVVPDSIVEKAKTYQQGRVKANRSFKTDSYQGSFPYTIVTAVYNAEAYLDDFFTSLFSQTIGSDSLRVIAVDDGSTDSSAEVIRAWQERYPEAIQYLYKENGGQASARNLGMQHVSTEWVTFIDPDDFVAADYFEQVDRVLVGEPDAQMVNTNTIFFYEKTGCYEKRHPLRHRFDKGDVFIDCCDEENMPIVLSMATAFFRMSEIRRQNLNIDEDIRPNFEDGHFANKYILGLKSGSVGFLRTAEYYYRKREQKTSTLDTSWSSVDRILLVPEHGYLDLLRFSHAVKGYVPINVQRTVLYDLSWYFKYFIGRPERGAFLSDSERAQFFTVLESIFSYISFEELFGPSNNMMWFEHKNAVANQVMKRESPYQFVYLKKIDLKKHLLLFQVFGDTGRCFIDNENVVPSVEKRTTRDFLGRSFYHPRELWVSFNDENQRIGFRFEGDPDVTFKVNGATIPNNSSVRKLVDEFTRNWGKYKQKGDTWLIMDRDTQADDNGEHFYRFMMKNHPEQRCFFVLKRDSRDWGRLQSEGFRLLDFGSRQHEEELKRCSKIISSHADGFVHSYFDDEFHLSKDFIFMQHGVTMNNLSSWLNGKRSISLMLTSTKAEYDSIVRDYSPYNLTSHQVSLTGFPRHDALLLDGGRRCEDRQTIVIMPTWRNSLAGEKTGTGSEREINDRFIGSGYKEAWESVLSSDCLHVLAEQGVRVVFFPHANVLPYVEAGLFTVPDYVELAFDDGRCTIQEYFRMASLFITDYSSTAFEAAYLEKQCLYYQFDRKTFFSGMHTLAKGYFDYERDGFGPVVTTESELVKAIEEFARVGFVPQDPYRSRMKETFLFRDGKCCERAYEAIKSLDDPSAVF